VNKLLVVISFLAVTACAPIEAPQSVDWYKEHKSGREAVLVECKQQALPASLNCENASRADTALAAARRGYVRPKPIDFRKGR
jgi:hypothetical protein